MGSSEISKTVGIFFIEIVIYFVVVSEDEQELLFPIIK